MPGMVTSIVESLKYLTPMAFDVMTFAVLRQLASPKKKLKVRSWRLASPVTHLYRLGCCDAQGGDISRASEGRASHPRAS